MPVKNQKWYALLIAVAAAAAPHSALAGFSWKAAGSSAPSAVSDFSAAIALPPAVNSSGNAQGIETVPLAPPSSSLKAAPGNEAAKKPVNSQEEVIDGFGTSLPLVVALQQIVPAGYQYSFTAGADPGVLVSWEGGKSWQRVLSDALARQKLGFHLKNNVVVIGRFETPPSLPVSHPAAPVAAPAVSAKEAPEEIDWSAPYSEPLPLVQKQGAAKQANEEKIDAEASAAKKEIAAAIAKEEIAKETAAAKKEIALAKEKAVAETSANVNKTAPLPLTITEKKKDTQTAKDEIAAEVAAAKRDIAAAKEKAVAEISGKAPASAVPVVIVPSSSLSKEEMAKNPPVPPQAPVVKTETVPLPPKKEQVKETPAMPAVPVAKVETAPVPLTAEKKDSSAEKSAPAAAPTVVIVPPAPAVEKNVPKIESAYPSAPSVSRNYTWHAEKGSTLRDILTEWSKKEGVELVWSLDYDYRMTEDAFFENTYENAVGYLLARFTESTPQPFGQLYQPQDGSVRVLIINSSTAPD